jgi:hypothetical protein
MREEVTERNSPTRKIIFEVQPRIEAIVELSVSELNFVPNVKGSKRDREALRRRIVGDPRVPSRRTLGRLPKIQYFLAAPRE